MAMVERSRVGSHLLQDSQRVQRGTGGPRRQEYTAELSGLLEQLLPHQRKSPEG